MIYKTKLHRQIGQLQYAVEIQNGTGELFKFETEDA